MKMHRFSGTTSREVLAKVKQALGEDAIIISNRAQNGRIEIMAAASTELELHTAAPEPVAAVSPAPKAAACAPAEASAPRSRPTACARASCRRVRGR